MITDETKDYLRLISDYTLNEKASNIKVSLNIFEIETKQLRELLIKSNSNSDIIDVFKINYSAGGDEPSENTLLNVKRMRYPEEEELELLRENKIEKIEEYELIMDDNEFSVEDKIDTFVELAQNIKEDQNFNLNSDIIIDKKKIIDEFANESSLEAEKVSRLNFNFWMDLKNLKTFIDQENLENYSNKFFKSQKYPIFIFLYNSINNSSDPSSSNFLHLVNLQNSVSVDNEDIDKYISKFEAVEKNTNFRNSSPVLSPCIFYESEFLSNVFSKPYIYSFLVISSDKVENNGNDLYKFCINNRANKIESSIDLDDLLNEIDVKSKFQDLKRFYQEYSRQEERENYVKLWRRSIAENCDNDLKNIFLNVNNIKEHYRFLEAEILKENFQDLTEAVKDTRSFMTDITSKFSDSLSDLSTEMQNLIFTLLGSVLANLFLIVRWSNIQLIIPFSFFTIIVMLQFYFPIIEERIDEIEELRIEANNDYKTYKEIITEYSDIFDFNDLETRKKEYNKLLEDKIKSNKSMVDSLKVIVLMIGLFFVMICPAFFNLVSIQFIGSIIFLSYFLRNFSEMMIKSQFKASKYILIFLCLTFLILLLTNVLTRFLPTELDFLINSLQDWLNLILQNN